MKKHQFLALLVVLAMFTALLCSCGTTSNSSTKKDVPITANNESFVPEGNLSDSCENTTDPENAETIQVLPVEGDTLKLSLWKVWPPFLSNLDPTEAYEFRYLEKLVNVKMQVKTVGTDGSDETFNLMVASGDLTDLIESGATLYSGGGTKAIEDGIFYDLADYLPVYAPDYYDIMINDSIGSRALVDADGKISQMMGFYDVPMVLARGLWIRQDWLDEQGLHQPGTLDELTHVLEVFRDEYGTKDAYAMRDDCEALITTAFDAHSDWYVLNGKVTYGKTEDSYCEYLSTLHDWYVNGLFSSDFVTANDSTAPLSAMILAGETGVVNADKTLISDLFAADTSGSINVQPIAPITKNAGDQIYNQFISTRLLTSSTVVISTGCEYPEIAVAYMNECFKQENKMAMNYGEEGVTFEYDENGTPHYTELITNNPGIPGSFATLAYISPGIPYLRDFELYNSTYTYDAQLIADDVFSSKDNGDESQIFPDEYLTFTLEESEVISQYEPELETYLNEMIAKFITGDALLEHDFDGFVAELENTYGLSELNAVYQAAYDRFNGSK